MVSTAIAFCIVLFLTVRPLGTYVDDIFAGRRTLLSRVVLPLETAFYHVCGIDPLIEMTLRTYAFALLAMSVVSVAIVYLALRLQASLPLNFQHFSNLAPDLAWNTAISRVSSPLPSA